MKSFPKFVFFLALLVLGPGLSNPATAGMHGPSYQQTAKAIAQEAYPDNKFQWMTTFKILEGGQRRYTKVIVGMSGHVRVTVIMSRGKYDDAQSVVVVEKVEYEKNRRPDNPPSAPDIYGINRFGLSGRNPEADIGKKTDELTVEIFFTDGTSVKTSEYFEDGDKIVYKAFGAPVEVDKSRVKEIRKPGDGHK